MTACEAVAMHPGSRIGRAFLFAVASIVLAGCGEPDSTHDDATDPTPAPTATTTPPADPFVTATQAWCGRSQHSVTLAHPGDPGILRASILRAAKRATQSGHRFVTRLALASGTTRVDAILTGLRTGANESRAQLAWSGPASLVLPDLDLRIVGDRITTRDGDDAWVDRGSASGVALDVGRELLDHPFLVRAVSGATHDPDDRTPTTERVDLVAPVTVLRRYATTERRGPVTDLLAAARSLRLTSTASGGELVQDRFTLVTRIPATLDVPGLRTGAPLAVTGTTRYCPLRANDAARIAAPTLTD